MKEVPPRAELQLVNLDRKTKESASLRKAKREATSVCMRVTQTSEHADIHCWRRSDHKGRPLTQNALPDKTAMIRKTEIPGMPVRICPEIEDGGSLEG